MKGYATMTAANVCGEILLRNPVSEIEEREHSLIRSSYNMAGCSGMNYWV